MGQIGRTALKAYFETGDIPTEAQFIDLMDSIFNFTDDDTDDVTESATKKHLNSSGAQLIAGVKEFSNLVHANNAANAVKDFTATPTFAFGTDGNDQQMTLSGNVTTFLTSGEVGSMGTNVYLINDGSVRTVVAPTGWTADPTSEEHTTAANAINRYQFYTLPNNPTKYFNLHIVKA